MKRNLAFAGLAMALAATSASAQSQGSDNNGGQPGVGGSSVTAGHAGPGNITPEQFNQLQDYANMSKRLNKGDADKGKTVDDLMKEDKAAATALTTSMPLSCQVDKAILAAQGPETVDGKTIQTTTYETVCSNGMGYFLISRESGTSSGISCFAADAVRLADVAAGRKPSPYCGLPELADVKVVATNVMTRAGTACIVRDYRWVGQNNAAHTEFDEVACTDNKGYILAIALPGSAAPVRISTCHDSAMRGLPCKLSDNGGAIVTKQVFKDALQKHAIACDAGEKDIHVFGQENVQKRYVVEFKCAQRPAGLVSYIPLAEAKAPFEVIDCAVAAKRGVKCMLTPAK
jgi:hypothetical protein